MKKLFSSILVLVSSLWFSGNAYAELTELNNCFQIKNSLWSNSDNFIKTTRYEKSDTQY